MLTQLFICFDFHALSKGMMPEGGATATSEATGGMSSRSGWLWAAIRQHADHEAAWCKDVVAAVSAAHEQLCKIYIQDWLREWFCSSLGAACKIL